MTPMHSSLPDDTRWTYTKVAGELVIESSHTDVLAGSAVIPPTEVLAIFNMLDYLADQTARCNAVKAP